MGLIKKFYCEDCKIELVYKPVAVWDQGWDISGMGKVAYYCPKCKQFYKQQFTFRGIIIFSIFCLVFYSVIGLLTWLSLVAFGKYYVVIGTVLLPFLLLAYFSTIYDIGSWFGVAKKKFRYKDGREIPWKREDKVSSERK